MAACLVAVFVGVALLVGCGGGEQGAEREAFGGSTPDSAA